MIRRFLTALFVLLVGTVATAQVPFPQTLPANTVYGRLGIGPGPGQAIPFATLSQRLPTSGGDACVNVVQFGADQTGVADSAAAFNAAFAAAVSAKTCMRMPAGKYRLASPIAWDLHTCCSIATGARGISIFGDGPSLTVLDFSTDSVASPNIKLFSSFTESVFRVRFGNFTVQTGVNGIAIQLGQLAATDTLDIFYFDPIEVQFFTAGAASVGWQINSLQSSLFVRPSVGWNGGSGVGLDSFQLLNSVQNTFIQPHAFGGSTVIHMTGTGVNQGNTFLNTLFELSTNGLVIDHAGATQNSFLGAEFSNMTTAVNATAGTANWATNPSFFMTTNQITGTTGFMLDPFPSTAVALNQPVVGGAAGRGPAGRAITTSGILYGSGSNAIDSNRCTMGANQDISCSAGTAFFPQFTQSNFTADTSSSVVVQQKSRAGGNSLSGDTLGAYAAKGFANGGFQNTAQVQARQAAAASGNNIPSAIDLLNSNAAGQLGVALTFDNKGHWGTSGGGSPTLTAGCNGAGSAVVGTDLSGTVTGQTAAATTCTLSFANAGYTAAPPCIVTGYSSPLTGTVASTTTTLVVNFASTANYKFTYFCPGL